MTSPVKIALLHHPTVGLHVTGFSSSRFEDFAETGVYLGNVYRQVIPPSLPRVATVLGEDIGADVEIVDLRASDGQREEIYRELDWEGYRVEARRVGAALSAADEAIGTSDWIGLTSHFTFESGIIRDVIRHAKRVNPHVRVMVGGADVKARPEVYRSFGADLVFRGDFEPEVLRRHLDARRSLPVHEAGNGRSTDAYRHPFPRLIRPAFHKLRNLSQYTDSHDGPVPPGVHSPIGFIYFTRGCPRECDFCESRRTRFEALGVDDAVTMLAHYRSSGIRTLNLCDDNLLLYAARPGGRAELLEILATMRRLRFAWEFPNGLELGRLAGRTGIDEELIEALFGREIDPETGDLIGAYRLYAPLETFERRDAYRKLRPIEVQNQVIARIIATGLPEINFGVVLPPDADAETFESVRAGYEDLQGRVHSRSAVRARYAIFHLIPIAEYRTMRTKYSVEDFPEGWNFHFPVYDGEHFSARELFERRLDVVRQIDPANFASMRHGRYAYESRPQGVRGGSTHDAPPESESMGTLRLLGS